MKQGYEQSVLSSEQERAVVWVQWREIQCLKC